MPLVPLDRPEAGFGDLAPLRPATPLDEETDPGFVETLGAAFRQGNIIGSGLASNSLLVDSEPVDADLNVWDEIKGTPYEEHWTKFADVTNRKKLLSIKADIDQESMDKRTLGASGLPGLAASLFAGVADVTTFIPGGTIVRGARHGYSAARSGVSVAGAAALGTAIQEGALHATQQTRTLEESAINVGASVILGGLIGAGAAKVMTRAEINKAVRALDEQASRDALETLPTLADDLDAMAANPSASGITRPDPADIQRLSEMTGRGGVGADIAAGDTIDDLSVAGRKAHAAGRVVAWLNPAMRMIYSPSIVVREVAEKMLELPVYLKKNLEGRATQAAAETLMKQSTMGLSQAIVDHRDIFKAMRAAGVNMDRLTFRRLVGRAMRRGDRAIDQDGARLDLGMQYDPAAADFIGRAAQSWRTRVFDPLKARAIENNLLPEGVGVEEADSYFTRVYLTPKIVAREAAWRGVIRGHLESAVTLWAEGAVKAADKRVNTLMSRIGDAESSKLRRAEELIQREQLELDTADVRISDQEAFGFLQLMRQGRPKTPETLTQFLHRQGGLVDGGGELKAIGVTHRARPGFLKRTRKGAQSPKGGLTVDDAGEAAFEAGFFLERPTPAELLDALADDFGKRRLVVRIGDEEAVHAAEAYDELAAQLSRLGLDAKSNRLPVGKKGSDLIRQANALLDRRADEDIAKVRTKITELEGEARIPRDLLEEREAGSFAAYIDDVVDSVTSKVLGRAASESAPLPPGVRANLRGPLKERTFHIQDRIIEDWLEDDIEVVARRYTRTMAADVELAEKFGRPDMDGVIEEVNESYRLLRQQKESDTSLSPLKREQTLERLERDRKSDVEDIQAVRDLLRGQYRAVDQVGNFARAVRLVGVWNYVTKLGGAGISNLTEVGKPVMVHGFTRVLGEGLPALITNMKGVRLAVKEARLAGTVAEAIVHSKLATVSEVTDPYSFSSPLERFLDNIAVYFSYANGLTPLTDGLKAFSSVLTQNRILENATRYALLSQRERDYMAMLGIDGEMARRIATQFEGGKMHAPRAAAEPAKAAPASTAAPGAPAGNAPTLAPFKSGDPTGYSFSPGSVSHELHASDIPSGPINPKAIPPGTHERGAISVDGKWVAGEAFDALHFKGDDGRWYLYRWDAFVSTNTAPTKPAPWAGQAIMEHHPFAGMPGPGRQQALARRDALRGVGPTAAAPAPAMAIDPAAPAPGALAGKPPTARLDAPALLGARKAAEEADPTPYAEWGSKIDEADLAGVQVRPVLGELRLGALLEKGIDPAARFASGDAPYLMVSTNNFAGGRVAGVVVNGAGAANLGALRAAFPDVRFMTVDEFKTAIATGKRAPAGPAAAAVAVAPEVPATLGDFEEVPVMGHGETVKGVRVANTEKWTDPQAVRIFRAAIAKDVDSTIVTAGVGDLPLWARTPLGRAVIQFRSFAVANHGRTMMRGMQEGTGRFLPGMTSMVMLGMFVYWLKTVERGAEVSDNPGHWVAEGLDRSGIFSLAFEANNTLEKLGIPGMYTAAKVPFAKPRDRTWMPERASRFNSRSNVAALAGPGVGFLQDSAELIGLGPRMLSEDKRTGKRKGLEPGDLRAIRGNIPGSGLPYWRWFIDRELMPAARKSVKG